MAASTEGVSVRKIDLADLPGVSAYVVSGDRFDTFLECVGKLVCDSSLTVKHWNSDGDTEEVLVYGEAGDDPREEILGIVNGY